MSFELASSYEPRGDQGQAIEKLTRSLVAGNRHQTLLGVTGSGKTFTVANVIRELDRPTLVMSHNKTLAAQLYSEFKQFFPAQRGGILRQLFRLLPAGGVHPAHGHLYRKGLVDQRGDRAAAALGGQLAAVPADTIVVASVSCIYGLASPDDFLQMLVTIKRGQTMTREAFLAKLVDMLYERNDIAFGRGKFRVRGDVVEVHPAQVDDEAIRVEFFGDEIERISQFDPLTGRASTLSTLTIYPAKQFVTPYDKIQRAMRAIREELDERITELERENKLVEAQRLRQRTEFDLEMMQEMGFCNGIENYSRHLSGRPPGSRPYTLMDFMPEDFLLVIDESHATVPQIGGMFAGDRSRKTVLVDYGFRLPSALDNRPLNFEEFMAMIRQIVYVSATPGEFELRNSVVGNATYLPIPEISSASAYADACRRRFHSKLAAGAFRPDYARRAARGRANHSADRPPRPKDYGASAEEPDRRDHRALPAAHREERAGVGHDADQANRGGPGRLPARHRSEGPLPPQRYRYDRAGRDPSRTACR